MSLPSDVHAEDLRSWPPRWRLEDVEILTQDAQATRLHGAIEIVAGRIVALGTRLPPPGPGVRCIPGHGLMVLPGFIQAHVHLCQTLFRGLADDLPLDGWLRERILPLEAAHDAESIAASARLGLLEALLGGATTLVDMGTVHHNDVIAGVVAETGARAVIGKTLMDVPGSGPRPLVQDPTTALAEALALHERWHGAAEGRLRVALAPRFTLSVSAALWQRVAAEARSRDLLVHTHVSETPWENETCHRLHGGTPVRTLERLGVLDARTLLVHAIWIDDAERELLAARRAGVAHCPGSNAKLGSGVLDVPALLRAGIPVGLGSDAAACNDELVMGTEMRLATQLQSLRHGPGRFRAADALALATRDGARAIGWDDEIGSLEVGKAADLVLFDAAALGWEEDLDVSHGLVFAGSAARPRAVFVAGRPLVWDGAPLWCDPAAIRRDAAGARARLLARFRSGGGR